MISRQGPELDVIWKRSKVQSAGWTANGRQIQKPLSCGLFELRVHLLIGLYYFIY